jgi:hypothetical protein
VSNLDQETQVRNSDVYTDTLSSGSGLETPVLANQNILFDLNALRSQVQKVIDPQQLTTPVNTSKWYTSISTALDNFGLRQIHDKKFVFKSPKNTNNQFGLGVAEISDVTTAADVASNQQSRFFVFYDTPTNAYYVWFNVSGGGVDPAPTAPGGVIFTGIMVAFVTGSTANAIASAIQAAIAASAAQVTASVTTNVVTITNTIPSSVTDVAAGAAAPVGFTYLVTTQGTNTGAMGKLVSSAMVAGGSGVIAVGPSAVTNNAYMAAAEANFTIAGTLGVGLSVAASSQAVTLNEVDIVIAGTNDPPLDAGTRVFGLLQVLTGTADGAAIAGPGSENLQLSFVKIHPNTDLLVAVTLPAGLYQFQLPYQQCFYGLDRGAFLSGGQLPDIIDNGSGVTRLPFRQFNITAGPAAANDPLNVQTGAFVTAGAQTVFASFGTPVMPSTADQFRDDSRAKIWRNGVLQAKGTGEDVTWVSTTQIAFTKTIKNGDRIQIESLAAF